MLAQVDDSRESIAHAVRESMAYLAQTNPGRAVELRVVPFRVVQLLGGTTHRRGTPPAVVECDAATWLELCTGKITWENAIATGALSASGVRSDLSSLIEQLAK
jgi:putative sterol carrier protein